MKKQVFYKMIPSLIYDGYSIPHNIKSGTSYLKLINEIKNYFNYDKNVLSIKVFVIKKEIVFINGKKFENVINENKELTRC